MVARRAILLQSHHFVMMENWNCDSVSVAYCSMPQTSAISTMTSHCPSVNLLNANNNRIVVRSRTLLYFPHPSNNCIQLSVPTICASFIFFLILYIHLVIAETPYLRLRSVVQLRSRNPDESDNISLFLTTSVTAIDKSTPFLPRPLAPIANSFTLNSRNLQQPLSNPNQDVQTKWQHPTT